jgi:zinc/manganese transport system substrate-binding protein
MRKLALAVGAAAVLAAAGCGSTPAGNDAAASTAGGTPLAVVATTPEVADFSRVIGGDRVRVTQIIKPNVDPHDYEPTPADIQAIATAELVVKNGVGLEEWLDRTIEAAGFAGTVVDTSAGVAVRDRDPHIWHNPMNAKLMVGTIGAAFARADPDGAATYRRHLADYSAQLDQLDRDSQAKIDKLPPERRKLVTNHDAFGYYVDRYRLEFVGSVIPSPDTSAELSARQLDDLVAEIRATGTTAIFAESSLPPKTATNIAQRAGVTVVAREDALYGDSLGPAGTPQGTYLGAERHNTDTIVAALDG